MDNSKPLLGFVGVGVMGGPMAGRLMAAGYSLVVYDPSAQAVAALTAQGARAAASAQAVADEATIVFTSLPSVAVFKQVGMGTGGVGDGKAVKVVVDLSTVGGTAAGEVAAALLAKGIDFVDAPVSGGAAGAKGGTLAVMVAGKPAVVETLKPMFAVFGKLFVIGEKPGQAQLMKLLNNMLSSTAFAVTAEAYVAGVRGGLDPEVMMNVFNAGSGRNNATSDKFPKYVLPRTFDFGFAAALAYKDVRLAVDEAEYIGAPMVVGSAVREMLCITTAMFGKQADFSDVVRVCESWAGVEVRG